ncbi:hypothetical protein HK096_009242, partial [Nowakowskiella sp. JEL0078]
MSSVQKITELVATLNSFIVSISSSDSILNPDSCSAAILNCTSILGLLLDSTDHADSDTDDKLDELGVSLWNNSLNIRKPQVLRNSSTDHDNKLKNSNIESNVLLGNVRFTSFSILKRACQSISTSSVRLKMFQLALKAAKSLIDAKMFDKAEILLASANDYSQALSSDFDVDKLQVQKLNAFLSAYRAQTLWLNNNNSSVSFAMINGTLSSQVTQNLSFKEVEEIMDIFIVCAKGSRIAGDGIKWFQNALTLSRLNQVQSDQFFIDAQSSILALISTLYMTAKNFEKAFQAAERSILV